MQLTLQILCLLAALSNLLGQTSAGLAADADILPLSKQARKSDAKGTRIDIPSAILAKIRANFGAVVLVIAAPLAIAPSGSFARDLQATNHCWK
jgi:hypothetical protein